MATISLKSYIYIANTAKVNIVLSSLHLIQDDDHLSTRDHLTIFKDYYLFLGFEFEEITMYYPACGGAKHEDEKK